MSIGRHRLRGLTVGLLMLPALVATGAHSGGEGVTLQVLTRAATDAFAQQAFADAARLFDELERTFGEEPEYRAPENRRVILALHGYARLASGDAQGAVLAFERYMESFPGPSRRAAFVLFSLAQAQQGMGADQRALASYMRYVREYGTTPEAALARLRVGEIHAAGGRVEEALGVLQSLYDSRVGMRIRQLARLRALHLTMEDERWDVATEILLTTEWDVAVLPEPSVVTFAALRIGDHLLRLGRAIEAVRAYRLVLPYKDLVRIHRSRQAQGREALDRLTRLTAGEAGAALLQARQSVARLEALQSQLAGSEDYTGHHRLRYGEAFSAANRHYEACAVFQATALNAEFAPSIRQEAHYRWIHEVRALQRWDDALEVAERFLESYPEESRIPTVLFLIANTYQNLGKRTRAGELLNRLIHKYPDHTLLDRWIFARGFNHLLSENYLDARTDFARYREAFSGGALADHSRLWHALSWFFEKQYEPARDELDRLVAELPVDHHLRPEAAYRRASLLYAQREYQEALYQVDAYIASYAEDRNILEAHVLRGDILMGEGQLEAAMISFRRVLPDVEKLYAYAMFQIGKIHRAREEYDALIEHFRQYLERGHPEVLPRRSEALYWIGWGFEQKGNLAAVVPLYEEAILRFGNDLAEADLDSLLSGLERIFRNLRQRPGADRGGAQVRQSSFEDWLSKAENDAWQEARWITYSRLRVYRAQALRNRGEDAEGREILLHLFTQVSDYQLDARGLSAIGSALQEAAQPGAEACFERLLTTYPHSSERVAAWLGLGREAHLQGDYGEALRWLQMAADALPTHPLVPEATLQLATTLLAAGREDSVEPVVDALLRLRSARGLPHAQALLILARAKENLGQVERAIPIYQRVYNLYRAYPEVVVPAYVRSAELFEVNGDLHGARETWREIQHARDLADRETRARAVAEGARLEALLASENSSAEPLERKNGEHPS